MVQRIHQSWTASPEPVDYTDAGPLVYLTVDTTIAYITGTGILGPDDLLRVSYVGSDGLTYADDYGVAYGLDTLNIGAPDTWRGMTPGSTQEVRWLVTPPRSAYPGTEVALMDYYGGVSIFVDITS